MKKSITDISSRDKHNLCVHLPRTQMGMLANEYANVKEQKREREIAKGYTAKAEERSSSVAPPRETQSNWYESCIVAYYEVSSCSARNMEDVGKRGKGGIPTSTRGNSYRRPYRGAHPTIRCHLLRPPGCGKDLRKWERQGRRFASLLHSTRLRWRLILKPLMSSMNVLRSTNGIDLHNKRMFQWEKRNDALPISYRWNAEALSILSQCASDALPIRSRWDPSIAVSKTET